MQPVLRRQHGAVHRNATRIKQALLQLVAQYHSDRTARIIIIVVILTELFFIALYLLKNALGYFDVDSSLRLHSMFNLDRDGGYPEMLNYATIAASVALLVGVFVASKEPVYAALALIFSFVLADDALSIHERGGQYFAQHFAGPTLPGLRLIDTGELLTWSIAAAFLLGVLAWAFRNSTPEAAAFGGVFAMILAILVMFGVGVDMVHVALASISLTVHRLLVIVEDGGEMLTIGLAFASSLLLYRLPGSAIGSGATRR